MRTSEARELIEKIAKREDTGREKHELSEAFRTLGYNQPPDESFLESAWNCLGIPEEKREPAMSEEDAWSLIEKIASRVRTGKKSGVLSQAFRVVGYKRPSKEALIDSARNAINIRDGQPERRAEGPR